MAQTLRLTVLTPEQVLLRVDEALRVRLRLADQAWISIYPGHAPLVAETPPGVLQYDTESETGEIELGAGILRVLAGEVRVLTRGQLSPERQQAPPEGDRQFDRLARQLMTGLGGSPASAPADEER